MIVIGLAGAHRTGKTTLANTFADMTGAHVCVTSTSAVFAGLGIDPKAELPFSERLMCQNRILMQMSADIEKAKDDAHAQGSDIVIVDRTPIDALAYLMADVQRTTPASVDGMRNYIGNCRALLMKHFDGVMQIQPGIPFVEEEGKAQANPVYIEHLNVLIAGASSVIGSPIVTAQMARNCLTMDDRIRVLAKFVRIIGEHVASGQAVKPEVVH